MLDLDYQVIFRGEAGADMDGKEGVSDDIIRMRRGNERFWFHDRAGTLLGTCVFNDLPSGWGGLPVPFVMDEDDGLTLYCTGGTLTLDGMRILVGCSETDNILLFLDDAGKPVIVDYEQGETVYRGE